MEVLHELDSLIPPDMPDTGWHVPAGSGRSTASSREAARFDVLDLDDIEIGNEPAWLIHGLMPASGLGVVFGLPKSGKSFILADAVFHVAMGREWCGRKVLHGSVAYVAGEGVSGFKRRMVAFREHYGVEGTGTPFGLVSTAPDLGRDSGDDKLLIEKIRAWHGSRERPPLRAVVIDTLTRSMRGADENQAKDMGVFVDNCARIATAFDCITIVVHHAGKDVERGARGSVALPAAADAMWAVEKGEGSSTVSLAAMKDGEDDLSWSFRLQTVDVGNTAEGDPITTCVVEILDHPKQGECFSAPAKARPLKGQQAEFMKAVRMAIEGCGESVPSSHAPDGSRGVTRTNLSRYTENLGFTEGKDPKVKRSTLDRHIRTLAGNGHLGQWGEWLWIA